MSTPTPNPAELYETFYGPGIFQPLAEVFVEFAAPRPGERVLDVACGTGMVARHVAPLVGAAGSVVAVDINPRMLAVARSLPAPEGAAIDFREADACTLDLPGASFDLVMCQQGLQFFPDRPEALRRIRDVMSPRGRVALALWQGPERQTLFGDFLEIEARHLEPLGVTYEDVAAPFSLGDPNEIRDLLEEAGFTGIRIEPRTVQARFPSPETFARNMETAYGAVIPAFAQDPDAFAAYLEAVEADSRDVVERYTQGDEVVCPMPANFALAYRE